MEEVMKVLQSIQHDLAQQKQDMKDMEENIKKAINQNIDEKFNHIEMKTSQLEQKIEDQQKTIDFLDRQMRKKNIIFFGVPESEKNYEDLLEIILDIINKKMDIKCLKWEIETVLRLGKKNDKLRPVLITISTTSRKLQLLKNMKKLENTGMYIKEDYTPAVLQKRKELQGEFQRRRSAGENVILRQDKIVQLKSKEQQIFPSKSSSNKRYLSESPEADTNRNTAHIEEQVKQVPKKNKPQNITSFLRPSQLSTASKPSANREYQEPPKN